MKERIWAEGIREQGAEEIVWAWDGGGNKRLNSIALQEDSWFVFIVKYVQGGSNMTGTDLCVNKPHCAAAVRLVYTQISPGHIWTTLYYCGDIKEDEIVERVCGTHGRKEKCVHDFDCKTWRDRLET